MTTTLERLEKMARRDHPEDVEAGRTVFFRVCTICGTAIWDRSELPAEGGVFRVEIAGFTVHVDECPPCREAFTRAPELAKWVMRVIRFQQEEKPSTTAGPT